MKPSIMIPSDLKFKQYKRNLRTKEISFVIFNPFTDNSPLSETDSDESILEESEELIGTPCMFTGICDSMGEELYNNDLYVARGTNTIYRIMFVSGAFVGGKGEDSCSPLGWIGTPDGQEMPISEFDWITKVGNIYENPELWEDYNIQP